MTGRGAACNSVRVCVCVRWVWGRIGVKSREACRALGSGSVNLCEVTASLSWSSPMGDLPSRTWDRNCVPCSGSAFSEEGRSQTALPMSWVQTCRHSVKTRSENWFRIFLVNCKIVKNSLWPPMTAQPCAEGAEPGVGNLNPWSSRVVQRWRRRVPTVEGPGLTRSLGQKLRSHKPWGWGWGNNL